MSKELNVQELLAELEIYRWRDKKNLILKKFGNNLNLGDVRESKFTNREIKIKAYEEKKWLALINYCHIYENVDELMLYGYTFDEIVRAIKEHIAETLAEEKENE